MKEINKTDYYNKDVDITFLKVLIESIEYPDFQIHSESFDIFLIDDEKPMLIHTDHIDMYKNIEEK